MDILTAHGIKCYVSDGVTLEPYSREVHASERQRIQSMLERRAFLRVTRHLQG
jgi:hypothetical protein